MSYLFNVSDIGINCVYSLLMICTLCSTVNLQSLEKISMFTITRGIRNDIFDLILMTTIFYGDVSKARCFYLYKMPNFDEKSVNK